jgi:Flp pilus assembly protein TadD
MSVVGGRFHWLDRIIPPLVLVVVALTAYHGTFDVPALLDDPTAISQNHSIRHLWPISEPLDPPPRSGTGGRPLSNLTFALNYAWTGTNLSSYHVVNLAIHILAGVTLFGIVRRTVRLIAGDARADDVSNLPSRLALAAAGLWVAHPVATIAVTYVSQRTELLMALLYLQALYGFIRAVVVGSAAWFSWSVAACLLGMASKEVMVTAPVAILLFDRSFIAGSFRAALSRRWRYYAGLATTWLLLGALLGTGLKQRFVGFDVGVDPVHYALTESHAILLYLGKAFWPANLVFDYGPRFLNTREAWPWVLAVLAVTAAVVVGVWRRWPVGYCGAWFLLVLTPTSTVVPIAGQPIAENRIYLPLAGVAIAMAVGLYRVAGRHATVALIALGVALTYLAERRNDTFDSATRLWTDTILKLPDNPRAYDNRGGAHLASGNLNAAIADFERALVLNPNSTQTHSLLGTAHLKAGQPDQAIIHYRHALELAPHLATTYQDLGAALSAIGDHEAAIRYFRKALEIDATLAIAHRNLGLLMLRIQSYAEAERHLRAAAQLDSDDAHARYALTVTLLALGRVAAAITNAEVLLEQHPEHLDARNALGVAFLRIGRLTEAKREFEIVLQHQPGHADARANLERTLSRP